MPPARKNWTRDSLEGIARLINYPPPTSVINPLATTVGDDSEFHNVYLLNHSFSFFLKIFLLQGGVERMRVNEYLSS